MLFNQARPNITSTLKKDGIQALSHSHGLCQYDASQVKYTIFHLEQASSKSRTAICTSFPSILPEITCFLLPVTSIAFTNCLHRVLFTSSLEDDARRFSCHRSLIVALTAAKKCEMFLWRMESAAILHKQNPESCICRVGVCLNNVLSEKPCKLSKDRIDSYRQQTLPCSWSNSSDQDGKNLFPPWKYGLGQYALALEHLKWHLHVSPGSGTSGPYPIRDFWHSIELTSYIIN